jgi:TolB-like protein/Flp pilus assembly protein TadD
MTTLDFYEFGPFRLDATRLVLFRDGKRVSLPPKAAELLAVLVEAQGNPVGKEEVFQRVWADTVVEEGSLTSHVSVLRKALGQNVDGGSFIETIPKRGYRFVAEVKESRRQPKAPFQTADRIMLAVVPFENLSGGEKHDYFSEGITEEMITQLAVLSPERLGVIARTSAMQYRASDKSIRQIGRELGVAYVLEGSVRRAGRRVRIAAQLIQVSDETHLWADSYERKLGDILLLQSEVAQSVAREIKIKLAPAERERLTGAGQVVPQAYESYLQGRYLLNQRTLEALQKSIRFFHQAIERDAHCAVAYAGLADAYLTLLDLGHLATREAAKNAKLAAGKARRLDDTLAEAHSALAHAYFHEFNWLAAEQEFRHAIKLNPNYANGRFYYANFLVALGRMEEAFVEARCAQTLDPASLPSGTNLASILYYSGHYSEAAEQSLRVLDMDSTFAKAHEDLGRAYLQQRMYRQAIAAFQKAVACSGRSSRYVASLGHAYAVAGKSKEALKLLQELKETAKDKFVSPCAFALVFAGLGNKGQAFGWLARAYRERDGALPFVKVNPGLALLRSDGRFLDLVRRMNFPTRAGS